MVVRVGLRPLERIGDTAGAIAAGDLTRRVEPARRAGPRSARLGLGAQRDARPDRGGVRGSGGASEERLRRFVADASHELRTPLTSIRGYAELFRRGGRERPEDLATSMRGIEDEAARMGVLVDDLLLLARLDQGRPLEREPVDLAGSPPTPSTTRARSSRIAPIELDADGPRIVGDARRLRQVLGNLLATCACTRRPGRRCDIDVSLAGRRGVSAVADGGPGIDPRDGRRVFERFYRGDPRARAAPGASGLGLSIVTAIVAAHGGEVTASAGAEGGTVFDVRLPVAGPPDAPTRPDASPTSRPRQHRLPQVEGAHRLRHLAPLATHRLPEDLVHQRVVNAIRRGREKSESDRCLGHRSCRRVLLFQIHLRREHGEGRMSGVS